MCEHQRCRDLAGDLAQVAVVPGGMDTLEHRRFGALAIPTDAEAVTIRRRRTESGMQTLVDQGVDRPE
jgi:hypothetical protein